MKSERCDFCGEHRIVNSSNGWHGKSTKGIAETDSFDYDLMAHGKFTQYILLRMPYLGK